VRMPKVSKAQVDKTASVFCDRMIAGLGLQKALTCNLRIGRLLRAEKARRKKLDEADQKKAKKRRKKKAIKSKASNGNQKGSDELSQLTSDSTCGSGSGRRES